MNSYVTDYAKSNKSKCKGCNRKIEKEDLRLAVYKQSPGFDGKIEWWYHFICFFNIMCPKSANDIENIENLLWKDQEKIVSSIRRGKKRTSQTALQNLAVEDGYTIEYCKENFVCCTDCDREIMEEEIMLSKKSNNSDSDDDSDGEDKWFHLDCFKKLRFELEIYECAESFPGFESLGNDDKENVLKELPAVKQEDNPEKRRKMDEGDISERRYREQNDMLHRYRNYIKNQLSKNERLQLLEFNHQKLKPGGAMLFDRLADIMTFGSLRRCSDCYYGQLVFKKGGYECYGSASQWANCAAFVKEPSRVEFKIPEMLANKHQFLREYKFKPDIRIIKFTGGSNIPREHLPLYDMKFVLFGNLKTSKRELKEKILKLGGKVVETVNENVMAVISTEDDVNEMGCKIYMALNADVHVVCESFLEDASNYGGRIPELVVHKSICAWGSDPILRLPPNSTSGNIFNKIETKVQGGTVVDSASGLENTAHVYTFGRDTYTAVLSATDIQDDRNGFYKLQILESNQGNRFWLFRSWGRIGTTIRKHMQEEMKSLDQAISRFCWLFKQKSGNSWQDRHNFIKKPKCMNYVDLDFSEELQLNFEVPSKLKPEVQDLVKLIFNIDNMEEVMLEFKLNAKEMPLGRLTIDRLQEAYEVLKDLHWLVTSQKTGSRLTDASNRFYTLLPHSFGTDKAPLINNQDLIEKKFEMLETLRWLHAAYSMMKASADNTIDGYYHQLNTDIDILDRKSEEFDIIQQYVKNTHAIDHSKYKLTVEEIYTIRRHGEDERFINLDNCKLLWHGSRISNFAGILSQGLRIAPTEALINGAMFGKGVYFADMVSKSANYCCTNPTDNIGLVLLSKVALGEMLELYDATSIKNLPKDKHSVKGVGKIAPDPASTVVLKDNTAVPLGKGIVNCNNNNSPLRFNEYIVYDVAQINIKYLLKLKFDY